MLSIQSLLLASQDYFLELAATDYYVQDGKPAGMWLPAGADELDLPESPSPSSTSRQERNRSHAFHSSHGTGK